MSDAASLDSNQSDLVTIKVTSAQIEQLLALGALTPEQAAAGRAAGGLEVKVSAALLAQVQPEITAATANANALEALAQQIVAAGMSGPARLFLSAGRPLSFFGSQLLLLAQPVTNLVFGKKDSTGKISRLLEDRRNVDELLANLERLENQARSDKSKKREK